MTARIVLFTDTLGGPRTTRILGADPLVALVGAGDRPAQHEALSGLAQAVGRPLLIQPPRKAPEFAAFVAALAALKPDLLLIDSYAMILPPAVLALAPRGAVNIHGALLPQYRGASVTEWALINEERESGVTMHVADAAVDAGPILRQERTPVWFEDTWVDVRQRVNQATEAMLGRDLAAAVRGELTPTPQDPAQARLYRRRRPEDGAFSWDWPTRAIYNLIRAVVAPHPGARATTVAGDPIVIDGWRSLASVAALKADPLIGGRPVPGAGGLDFRPLASVGEDRRQANAAIDFVVAADGRPVGRCRIAAIDPTLGAADLAFGEGAWSFERRAAALAALGAFAKNELGLTSPLGEAGAGRSA